MTAKAKFICVSPKSKKAKNRFSNLMDNLHSCRVEQEQEDKMFLASISGKYFFWMDKFEDPNWIVCK